MAAPRKASKGKAPAPAQARVTHATVAKPTSVTRVEPQGVPVNPRHTNGNPVPNEYPYRPDQTEWAVINK